MEAYDTNNSPAPCPCTPPGRSTQYRSDPETWADLGGVPPIDIGACAFVQMVNPRTMHFVAMRAMRASDMEDTSSPLRSPIAGQLMLEPESPRPTTSHRAEQVNTSFTLSQVREHAMNTISRQLFHFHMDELDGEDDKEDMQ